MSRLLVGASNPCVPDDLSDPPTYGPSDDSSTYDPPNGVPDSELQAVLQQTLHSRPLYLANGRVVFTKYHKTCGVSDFFSFREKL